MIVRGEFDLLDIGQQVKLINENLKSNISFTKACKEINIPKSTLSERFKRNGYTLQDGLYGRLKEIKEVPAIKNKPDTIKKEYNKNDTENILTLIQNLTDRINKLESKGKISIKNNIKHFDGNLINKSFKIDRNIYNDLENLFEKYDKYKKQDIINTIIEIGMKNL